MQRYKITIEYDGTNYCGFQRQNDATKKSIQEELETAIFKMSACNSEVIASGRTDAGVHAFSQTLHFDLEGNFEPQRILMALNYHLKTADIAVLDCESVDENFHARFDCKMRHYRYIISNRRAPLVLQKNRSWHIPQKLNLKNMIAASQFLVGQHDFSSFRDAKCQAQSPIKTIEKLSIKEVDHKTGEIFIEISAKSFLHHMVRNIAGTLVFVGLEKIGTLEIKEIIEARDRTRSGPNAPACGLYFLCDDY